MRRVALAFLLTCTACYSQPDGFITAVAKHTCKRTRECNQSFFDNEYGGDMGACREDREEFAVGIFDAAENLDCEYIPEEGRECIAALRENRTDCSSDADEEILRECGLNFDLSIDYFDCG